MLKFTCESDIVIKVLTAVVGYCVGLLDGDPVGLPLGWLLGLDGMKDGWDEGRPLGCEVGRLVG